MSLLAPTCGDDADEEEARERAFDAMPWPVPQNTVAEINAAGKVLIAPDVKDWAAWYHAHEVLNK